VVLACSALKRAYRDTLRSAEPPLTSPSPSNSNSNSSSSPSSSPTPTPSPASPPPLKRRVHFVLLQVSKAVVAARAAQRTAHFMSAALIDSQFQTLEAPAADEQVLVVHADAPVITRLYRYNLYLSIY
jgi:gluconate kinase